MNMKELVKRVQRGGIVALNEMRVGSKGPIPNRVMPIKGNAGPSAIQTQIRQSL
jgi:hypothetical protein